MRAQRQELYGVFGVLAIFLDAQGETFSGQVSMCSEYYNVFVRLPIVEINFPF